MELLDWNKLFCAERRKPSSSDPGTRTEFERDHDRIVFSTPVRRLADKTQVFPLERNDSVRNRLTHSYEVSNLARSLGIAIANGKLKAKFPEKLLPERSIPAILAAIGLVHDLGNPPFGHQGENAIQSWFASRKDAIFNAPNGECLDPKFQKDFLKFEGNAQTFRLVSTLQILDDFFGLNLTYGTLAAMLKYPITSDRSNKEDVRTKKYCAFQSERKVLEEVFAKTGLDYGERHPFAYIMEACDDIAYLVLDAEDAVKKGIVSFNDIISYLLHHVQDDELTNYVVEKSCKDQKKYREKYALSSSELNEICMQKFRVHAMSQLIPAVQEAFEENFHRLLQGGTTEDLVTLSKGKRFCEVLRLFDKSHAYNHRAVLEVELEGYNVIQRLMSFLWVGISQRESFEDVKSKRTTPFAAYAFSRISESYRRIYISESNEMPTLYKDLQLLTDVISGMTDSFALSLCADLEKYYVSA